MLSAEEDNGEIDDDDNDIIQEEDDIHVSEIVQLQSQVQQLTEVVCVS
jgi:hypothetical protein